MDDLLNLVQRLSEQILFNGCHASIKIGCCTFLSTGSMVYIHTENNSSQLMTCAEEGLYKYSCQPGLVPSEARMVHCRRDGTWSPNPHDLDCHHLMTETYATISPTLGTIILLKMHTCYILSLIVIGHVNLWFYVITIIYDICRY